MRPHDLISTAELMLSAHSRKPSTTTLCRALSTAYYALFHCLAQDCADLLIGKTRRLRSEPAWRQVYRALDHGEAQKRCQNARIASFPKGISDFASAFVTLQKKRHAADYDPTFRVSKSAVEADIALSADSIRKFELCNAKDRRAFCVWVLLKDRTQ